MKRVLCSLFFVLCQLSTVHCQLSTTNIDEVLAAMTLQEKAELVVGNGWGSMFAGFGLAPERGHVLPGAAGETRAIPRLGIPSIVLSDGPSGVRHKGYSIAFPAPILMASSFDTALVYQLGRLMAEEALQKGVDVMLGPGMNIQRSPLCGRNFEYFSEDPVLSGQMATAMVRGLQDGGVGACVKHYVANNQETNRMSVSAEIDSLTLHRIYLENFRRPIQEAQPWCVMSAYNAVNGVPCQTNSYLLTDVLREQWGYDGVVMTDWWFGKQSAEKVRAGNDLLMPGGRSSVRAVVRAVKKGQISEERLNEAARRMLQLIVKTPTFKHTPKRVCTKNILLRQATAQSMVLLENKDHTLPLQFSIFNSQFSTKVALFGCASYDLLITGTGSGYVQVAAAPDMVDGLNEAGFTVTAEPMSFYAGYMKKRAHQMHQGGFGPVSKYTGRSAWKEPLIPDSVIARQAQQADVAILTICRQAGEAVDRSLENDWFLTEVEKRNLEMLTSQFHAQGKRVVVVLNICGPIETMSWKHLPDAILLCWLPGQEGGLAIGDVLSGRTAPRGKLPITFPADYFEHPTSATFPLPASDNDLIPDSLTTNKNPLPQQGKGVGIKGFYTEGEQVGHFFYDATGVAPSYPFGYGLSY